MPQACSNSTTALSLKYTVPMLRAKNLRYAVIRLAVGSRKAANWQLSLGEVNGYAAFACIFC